VTSTPSTAWHRIARDIAARIVSGETPVGSKIPSQQQLLHRHDASLGTVKRAIEHLQERGVLQGVQGAGVFVRRLPDESDLGVSNPASDDRLRTIEERLHLIEDRLSRLEGPSQEPTAGRVDLGSHASIAPDGGVM
jgi:DNA-binding GntR family transcriptional regulator